MYESVGFLDVWTWGIGRQDHKFYHIKHRAHANGALLSLYSDLNKTCTKLISRTSIPIFSCMSELIAVENGQINEW